MQFGLDVDNKTSTHGGVVLKIQIIGAHQGTQFVVNTHMSVMHLRKRKRQNKKTKAL